MLASSICSVTARLVGSGDEGRSFSARCSGHIEHYLLQNMGKIDVDTLTLTVLAAVHSWIEGNWARCWMYHGMAARMCKALPLDRDGDGDGDDRLFVQQECARRLVWQIFVCRPSSHDAEGC